MESSSLESSLSDCQNAKSDLNFENLKVMKNLTFDSSDGLKIFYDIYEPNFTDSIESKNVIIQIAHGMVEHKERYTWLCSNLANRGYIVGINDHRGHGKSVDSTHFWGEMVGSNSSSRMQSSRELDSHFVDERSSSISSFESTQPANLTHDTRITTKQYSQNTNSKSKPARVNPAEASLGDFVGCQGSGDGSLLDIKTQATTADSRKSVKKATQGNDGFMKAIDDMFSLTQILKQKYKNKKFVLLGHSMGSLLSRGYLKMYGENLDALILSGSPANNPLLKVGIALAKMLKFLKLESKGKEIINNLSFGGFNKPFANPSKDNIHSSGPCAWICRDKAIVDAYLADKACQFIFSLDSFIALFRGTLWVQTPLDSNSVLQDSNRVKPPILILSGESDACGNFGKGVKIIAQNFESSGFKVTLKLYPNARHEIFNEINKEEILNDLLLWLKNNGL
ncbi:alpha/beta fold hydrolase [Helicobacter saguini]|uniref:Alpha/beta fold hydrolase n=1 Tax=Helicobacter saguini TaxID=1548018 RepID=A0A347VVI7_9HELI|nr:alpha/beta hydrolase [Helicobacter saguini]MWV62407.1 alpha/beta fold hydrolase [Helicobacter saguini]MWV66921.1 alpha/beta fold hydrolase [Helicobacter saguini]MWV69269.1 alpha/beta fold hydrolase [Helicobacter saguini]MWV71175.1 alpha/beta fold hydrolase [Helicobacter saguini]TLD94938.1 alpha/beta hydrolase [Helicobacter saguini]